MSHDPHAPGNAPHGHDHEESLSGTLANAQFVITAIFILVIASLAYIAGTHSAKGGHGGEGGGTSAAPAAKVDVQALIKPTPDLIAKGKTLFAVNCASCHGTTGKGDGPASVALNPKPRDFTSGYWRYGGGEARVVRTISEGSPGTAMAAFPAISLEDRFALAHYVRSLAPKQEEDKPEDLAWLGPTGGTGGESGGAAAAGGPATPQPSVATMPIERAIALLAQPEPKAGVAMTASSDLTEPGASLYSERCASCHGGAGEGGVRVRMIGSAPYAYVESRSLGDAQGAWAGDSGAFERLIVNGLPGYVMPANGDLSREALQDLRGYTLKLRVLQQGARRTGS